MEPRIRGIEPPKVSGNVNLTFHSQHLISYSPYSLPIKSYDHVTSGNLLVDQLVIPYFTQFTVMLQSAACINLSCNKSHTEGNVSFDIDICYNLLWIHSAAPHESTTF